MVSTICESASKRTLLITTDPQLEAVLQQASFHFTAGFDFDKHLKQGSFCIKFSEANPGSLSVYFKENGALKGRRILDNLGKEEEEVKYLYESHTLDSIGKKDNLKAFLDAHADIFGTKCCDRFVQKFNKKDGVDYDNSTVDVNFVTTSQKGNEKIPSNPGKEPLNVVTTTSSSDKVNANEPTKRDGVTVMMKKNGSADVYYMIETDLFLALYSDQKVTQSFIRVKNLDCNH